MYISYESLGHGLDGTICQYECEDQQWSLILQHICKNIQTIQKTNEKADQYFLWHLNRAHRPITPLDGDDCDDSCSYKTQA